MIGVNISEILIANGLGLILVIGILKECAFRQQNEQASQMMFCISIMVLVCCTVDMIVSSLDGHGGELTRGIIYVGNLLLYLTNLFFGSMFVLLVERSTSGRNSAALIRTMLGADLLGIVLLVINAFVPMLFSVDGSNCYQRGPLFLLFDAIGVFILLMALYVYAAARVKGGVFKFFPVLQLLIPVMVGLVFQTVFFGISLLWPCAAVGLTLMMVSAQNRLILVDKLTDLYNRYYLDTIDLSGSRFCLMMLDLNSFKEINDRYGHLEGDSALVATARVLRRSVGSMGTAVRYAGDEFMILLNVEDPQVGQACVDRINRNLANYNSRSGKPYQLTVSIGWGIFDLDGRSMDDLVEIVDARMYDDKRAYYEKHDRRRRDRDIPELIRAAGMDDRRSGSRD